MITRFGGSMRRRLALFASLAMALICVVVNSFVLYALYNATVEYKRVEVVDYALHVVHMIKRNRLPDRISSGMDGVQVVDASGRVIAAGEHLTGAPRISHLSPHANSVNHVDVICDVPALPDGCQMLAVFRVYQPEGDWLVYVSDATVPWYVTPQVPLFLFGLSAGLVTLTWLGVSRVVARTLAPVDRIRAKLADVSATRSGMRVPVPETDDEIRDLALTANQTLDRLEEAAEQQRRFASDASHDLRSPITAMRAQVEEAMLHPHDADWPQTGEALLASLDRLQAIVSDLLTLAKLDAGEPPRLEPVDLGELVTAETRRPRAHRVVVTVQPGVVVTGDRLRLARLLTNLLDNADRHAECTVIVTVRKDGQAMLEVLDDGAGIAPDKREMVFNRFTRLDASRSRDAGGTGLGLPIAREIAAAHHGTLTIEDSETGARFVLRLPLRET
ncbi:MULTISPECIES: HAMP domain-containing sensor histidine kinase [Nonomuraea]|uniref:sensor histidine kinase n=1 Tax=Nonomuraea TaxID=83681 RepID=UPI0027E0F94F|nr:HAMP domain-containing sensor histidine kinase [Nonomuraea ceibae]